MACREPDDNGALAEGPGRLPTGGVAVGVHFLRVLTAGLCHKAALPATQLLIESIAGLAAAIQWCWPGLQA
jgi:hypothetical protein